MERFSRTAEEKHAITKKPKIREQYTSLLLANTYLLTMLLSMVIIFIIVLLVIGIGIALSTYMLYAPFVTLLGDIKSYNIAYYGAQWWLERWLLVSRYKQWWFVWSWWWIGQTTPGSSPLSDGIIVSDKDHLWRLTDGTNSLIRSVQARTDALPSQSDILLDLQYQYTGTIVDPTRSSSYFGALRNNQSLNIPLSLDTTTDPWQYYTTTSNTSNITGQELFVTLRLPPLIQDIYIDTLCLELSCDDDGDRLSDEVVVSWWWWGTATTVSGTDSYVIIPQTSVIYNTDPPTVISLRDNNIRKTTINSYDVQDTQPYHLRFVDGNDAIFDPVTTSSSLSWHNIISPLKDSIFDIAFDNLLSLPSLTQNNILTFELIRPLRTRTDSIYPYLEYRITSDQSLSDSAYRISGQARVWSYNITVSTSKPVMDTNTLSDFTIIF